MKEYGTNTKRRREDECNNTSFDIHNEIMIEILSRFLVKSLLRFRNKSEGSSVSFSPWGVLLGKPFIPPNIKYIRVLANDIYITVTQCNGFGFDFSARRFKVLRSYREYPINDEGLVEFEILTLISSNASWRNLGISPYWDLYRSNSMNGKVYWMIPPHYKENSILTFSFKDGKFSVLGGCLCIADRMDDWILDIWMLKDDINHVWVKGYSINFNQPIFVDLRMNNVNHFAMEIIDEKAIFSQMTAIQNALQALQNNQQAPPTGDRDQLPENSRVSSRERLGP
ncbi:hypothetical protein GIB67_015126 [Kingdonia uniflora]|uniref:F-box associated beta-propeller type 1 domain-containing protein n=1 Tax=Kingdonia uniflora TaxID=39325 RepID=A0A7J7LJE0_9MAGN|nr:hypothetical protein GIB67_015126 [Kingdonia uniflora]